VRDTNFFTVFENENLKTIDVRNEITLLSHEFTIKITFIGPNHNMSSH